MSPPDAEPERMTTRRWWWPAAAVALGLLFYSNSIFNDFTYDDNAIVRLNPRIHSLTNFREIWLTDWWFEKTADQPYVDPARDRLYRPLTLFSFALNYAIHESSPMGYHVGNVVLHGLACWLVWCFARRLLDDDLIAGVAAILFAVHPVHSEAIAGIVGRGEILAAGFMLAGLVVLLPREKPPSIRRVISAGLLFLAALLSKETAVCYPAVALLVMHAAYRLKKLPLRWWMTRTGCLLAPLAVYFPLRFYALEAHFIRDQAAFAIFNPLADVDWLGRLHGPFTILGHYARLLLVPQKLSCDYGFAIIDPRSGPELLTLVGLAAVVVLLAALLGYRRENRTWRNLGLFGALFLASYALISNTVLLIGVSLAERLMYWPSVPILLAVAVAAVTWWRKACGPDGKLHKRAAMLRALGIMLLLALGLRGLIRNMDWKNDEALFTADLKTYPRGVHLNNGLANIYIWLANRTPDETQRNRLVDEAQRMLQTALSIYSRDAEARSKLGLVYILRGDNELALEYLQSALWLDPADKVAQKYIARLQGDQDEIESRVAELYNLIERQPNDPAPRIELAQLLIRLGRNVDALIQCEQLARMAPENIAALRLCGDALVLNLQMDQALAMYRRVLALDAADWQAHANVAQLLATREPAESLHHARIAFDLQPNHMQTQLNLAEALAINGYLEEALQRFQSLVNGLPPDHPRRPLLIDRIEELRRERP